MKKLIVTVLLTAGLLVGCGTGQDATPVETKTATVAPVQETTPVVIEETPDPTNDEVYLKSIKVAYPVLEGTPDADLVSLANSLCAAFDKSATFEQVLALGIDAGLDAEMSGYLIGAAVNVYCPNHLDEIN